MIEEAVASLGEPRYRARQVYEAITRGLVTDFAAMTSLPVRLRAALAERLEPVALHEVETRVSRRGGARKTLFVTADGHLVEAVLMALPRRATVCVSSQVGCAVGCAFCASGRLGLRRDLTAEEMVDQVLAAERVLRPDGRRVTNVVVMGMGEPFHNYDETLRACRALNDPEGFGLAARAISIMVPTSYLTRILYRFCTSVATRTVISRITSSSRTSAMSGIMISGATLIFSLATSQAASMIACTCISEISG